MDREKAREAAVIAAENSVRGEAAEIIRAAVDKVMRRVRQNLGAEAQSKARPLLTVLAKTLQDRCVSLATSWAEGRAGDEPVLPDHCKFFKRLGGNCIVVLEYKPQVRSLLFSDAMIEELNPLSSPNRRNGAQAVLVTLPYVILTIPFSNNVSGGVYVNYRNSPLTSTSDKLYHTNLPNVQLQQTYSRVCFGQSQWANNDTIRGMSSRPIAEQVDSLVGGFWQTVFNGDYSERYSSYAQKEPRLYLKNWNIEATTNPGFITKCRWDEMCSLKTLIDACIKTEGGILGPNFVTETEALINRLIKELDQWCQESHAQVNNDTKTVDAVVKEKLVEIVATCCQGVLNQPAPVSMPVLDYEDRNQLEMDRLMLLKEIERLQRESGRKNPYEDNWRSW